MNYSRSLSISSSSNDPYVDVEEEVSYGTLANVPVTEIRKRRISKSSELHEHLDKVMKTFKKLEFFDSIQKLENDLLDQFPEAWDVDKNTFDFSKLTRRELNEAKGIIDVSLGPVGRHIRSEIDRVLLQMANELKSMSGKVTSDEYRSDLPQIEYSLDRDKLLKEIADKEKQAALNELNNDDDDDMDSDTVSSDDEYQETITTPKIEDVTDFVEPTISVFEHSEYGPILVGDKGMTLYVFTKDEDNKSNCFGDCLVKWPPLKTLGEPNITSDRIVKRKIGSTSLEDGNEVVTYFGRPLYYWYQDEKPGDISGQNVGGVWFLVSAKDGKPVKRRRTPLKKVPQPQKREVKEETAITLFKVPEAKEKPLKRSKIDEEKKQVVVEKKEELLPNMSLPQIKVYQDFFEWCPKKNEKLPEEIFKVIKAWFPRSSEESFRSNLEMLSPKLSICSSMRQNLKKFIDLFNANIQKVRPDQQQRFTDATIKLLSNPPQNLTMSPLVYFETKVIPKIKYQ